MSEERFTFFGAHPRCKPSLYRVDCAYFRLDGTRSHVPLCQKQQWMIGHVRRSPHA